MTTPLPEVMTLG